MTLQEKYKSLTDAASAAGVTNLQVRDQDGVLYVDGIAPNGSVKDQLWNIYDTIDPNYLSGTKVKVTTEKSNLNIRKGPGTDQPIVGKAAHGEVITLVSQSSEQWWLVRTDDGEEGYAYAQYLTPEA